MMNFKQRLFLISLLTVIISTVFSLYLSSFNSNFESLRKSEKDNAIALAKKVYHDKKVQGVDFSSGPCLTNDLTIDWVADLVHKPRQEDDDFIVNQCQAFLEGRAHHFVELDLNGDLVRIY